MFVYVCSCSLIFLNGIVNIVHVTLFFRHMFTVLPIYNLKAFHSLRLLRDLESMGPEFYSVFVSKLISVICLRIYTVTIHFNRYLEFSYQCDIIGSVRSSHKVMKVKNSQCLQGWKRQVIETSRKI